MIRNNQTDILYMTHTASNGIKMSTSVNQEGRFLVDDGYLKSNLN